MLVCRHEDDAILGFFNLSQIVSGRCRARTWAMRSGSRIAGQGYMREGIELVLRRAFTRPAPAPRRGEHPAGQPRLDRARPAAPASAARDSRRAT